MRIIKKIKDVRTAFKKKPKTRLILRVISALYASIMIFSVVMIAFITDTLSNVGGGIDSYTILAMTLLMLEFCNSIVFGLFFGQYLVEINKISREKTGVSRVEESKIVKSVMYFQFFYLFPGMLIIIIGTFFILLLFLLTIILFKIFIFTSISLVKLLTF